MNRYTHWTEEHLGLQYSPVDVRPARKLILTGLGITLASSLIVCLISIPLFSRRAALHVQVTTVNRVEMPAAPSLAEKNKPIGNLDSERRHVSAASPAKKVETTAARKIDLPHDPVSAIHLEVAKNQKTEVSATLAPAPPSPSNLPARPSNIASAEKFGIRQVASDMIVLLNGSRVAINGRFPNGEILMSIDQAKGVIETDHRTMVITSP